MYNATNSAPHRPSLHRLNSLLSLSLLSTAQLNDLFITSLRSSPRCFSTERDSSQLNDLFINLIAPHRSVPPCAVLQHGSTPLDATQRFVCQFIAAPRLNATWLDLALHGATQFNATICFLQRLSTRLGFSQGTTAPRRSPRLNSTQRFVCQFILRVSTRRYSARLGTSQRPAYHRHATQRFVCQFIITTRRSALLRHAPRRVSTRRNSTQRTET